MKFEAAPWLWALLVVPFLWILLHWDHRRRQKLLQSFVFSELWRVVAPHLDIHAKLKKGRYWILGLVFLILALARPQWGTREEVIPVSGLDILIALDLSSSMEVEDVVPSRLQKAKHVIRSVLERLHGDRVGLVPFAASSYVACPLTTDLDYVQETLQILSSPILVNQGTNIGLGLETAMRALDRAAEESETHSQIPVASRVIILISDGENHADKAIEIAQKIKASGAKFFVFGIGTEKGGPIPLRDVEGVLQGYKKDKSGSPIVSQFKPNALMEIASAGGGRYWNVTHSEIEVEELLRDLGSLERTDYAERRYVVYEERFQIPLALALLFLFLELSLPMRRLSFFVLFLLLLDWMKPMPGWAAPKSPPLNAFLENERGLKAFKKGDYETARQKFDAAQALDPLRSELQFNRGVMRMQDRNLDGAIEDFSGAFESARESEDPSLMGQSAFNLGVALSQKGDVAGALQAYLKSIEGAKVAKNGSLENDARKNIELLEAERKKQKEQQSNQNKEAGSGSASDEKNTENKPNSSSQDEDQKKNSATYQDPSKKRGKKEFKSTKMTQEDADRVMAELSNRERELQAKLKKQKGTPRGASKDW